MRVLAIPNTIVEGVSITALYVEKPSQGKDAKREFVFFGELSGLIEIPKKMMISIPPYSCYQERYHENEEKASWHIYTLACPCCAKSIYKFPKDYEKIYNLTHEVS